MAIFFRMSRRRLPDRWGSRARQTSASIALCSKRFTAPLRGGVLMLVHIGQPDVAELVHNAWLRTIEDGVHTYDIFKEGTSKQKVGTKEFAEAVVARLGQRPEHLKPASYAKGPK